MAAAPPEDVQDDPGDPDSVARAICLRLLTQRARTRAELAQALTRRGVPDDVAGRVLDRFTEVGLIDDSALADSFALRQHHERGLAGRAVAVKLRQRGLDEQTVQTAIGQIDPDSEHSAALRLARHKLRTLDGLDAPVRTRRIYGLLARRGYSPEVALRVVREVERAARAAHGSDTADIGDTADTVT